MYQEESLTVADHRAIPLPTPTLTYRYSAAHHTGEGLIGEGSQIFRVHTVTASCGFGGALRLCMQGPMRKQDGTRGSQQGCLDLDLDAEQPPWVATLASDARKRLPLFVTRGPS